jgi:GTP-binding protein EngB required for normal cell division
MSSLIGTLRKSSGRASDVADRLAGLEQAVDAARGRLDDGVVDEAAGVVGRASARLKLSGDHTVVALAGSTGSGKSSLFNALVGLDIAATGVRRPTTSFTTACTWGPDGAAELLDWLDVPPRHRVDRSGLLDDFPPDPELAGLVLLDLPDHDSTEVSHHLEVERLVRLADVLVWILDPQKYADAAVHDRFLKPFSSHADVMMVVLNHVDELPADAVDPALTDLKRLLTLDGLEGVPVLVTSATRGDGLDELRRAIVERVAQKRLARERLTADVKSVAGRLADQTGTAKPPDMRSTARGEILEACSDAAGVPVVEQAIANATKLRARRATGWPVTKWLARLRPDPLKRLRLDVRPGDGREGSFGSAEVLVARSSIPQATPVQRARVDTAVRQVADEVSRDLPRPWAAAVRRASVSRVGDVTDALDLAVARTDLGVARDPRWWAFVRTVQWLLFLVAVGGGLWLAGLAFFAYLRLPEPPTAEWRGIALPTLMLVGGVVAGLVVAGLSRLAAGWSANRRAHTAGDRLRKSIAGVVDEMVVQPVQAELDAYVRCRDGLQAALRR